MSNPFLGGALGAAGATVGAAVVKGAFWTAKKAYRGARALGAKLKQGHDTVKGAVEAEDLQSMEDTTL